MRRKIVRTATAYSSVPLGSTNVRLMVEFVGLNLWYFGSSGCAMRFSASLSSVWRIAWHVQRDALARGLTRRGGETNLQGLERNVPGVRTQDTWIDHPAELLPLLVASIKIRRLTCRCCSRRCCCMLSFCLQSALYGCRHSIVVRTRCSWLARHDGCFRIHFGGSCIQLK